MSKRNLGLMLLESSLIDEIQMKIALEEQKRTGKRFGSTLVDLQFIDENVLAAFLSKQMDIPCINIMHVDVLPGVKEMVPYEVALRCEAVPIKRDENMLYVAMADPTDINLISELEEATGCPVTPFIAPQSSILKKAEQLYREDRKKTDKNNPMFSDVIREVEDLESLGEKLKRIEDQLTDMRNILERLTLYLSGKAN